MADTRLGRIASQVIWLFMEAPLIAGGSRPLVSCSFLEFGVSL
jgi:hypothetical protein